MKMKRRIIYHYSGALLTVIGLVFFLVLFLFTVTSLGDVGMGRLIENPVVIVAVLASLVLAPLISVIYFKTEQQRALLEYSSRSALRYMIAFIMFFYGYTKMYHKFFEITYFSQDTRLADLDSFTLVWYFFGRSNVQEFIIGLLEFVPAILILFRRTSFIAYVLLLPVALNVLMVNTFNHVSGITFPLSVFIVLADTYLLYGHKAEILRFLKSISEKRGPQLNPYLNILRWLFKLLIYGAIIYFFAITIYISFFRKHTQYSGRNKFTGGFEMYKLLVNDSLIHPDSGNVHYYKSIYIEPQSRWNVVLTYATQFQPRVITIKWNAKNDSVITFLTKENSVTKDAVDPATEFVGTYVLKADTLTVDGLQYGQRVHAKYFKKNLRDYKWFW